MIQRDEKWERVMRTHWESAQQTLDNERKNQEDYWYPLIDEALATGDFEEAIRMSNDIPDVVTFAFAQDRIRQARKRVDFRQETL